MNICASDQCSEELLKLISLDLSAFHADKLRLIFLYNDKYFTVQ